MILLMCFVLSFRVVPVAPSSAVCAGIGEQIITFRKCAYPAELSRARHAMQGRGHGSRTFAQGSWRTAIGRSVPNPGRPAGTGAVCAGRISRQLLNHPVSVLMSEYPASRAIASPDREHSASTTLAL